MTLHAGHCTTCDTPIWRTVTHGRTGQVEILYPRPDSVYARVRYGAGVTPGVGYCAQHVPPLGDDVVGLDTAANRYAFWFTPAFGAHLRAWLEDHCELAEHERSVVMDQWLDDCKAVEGVHA